MRGNGEKEPFVLINLTANDKSLFPKEGMKMRALVKANHNRYAEYEEKLSSRKVIEM
jgi:hypothetical protein